MDCRDMKIPAIDVDFGPERLFASAWPFGYCELKSMPRMATIAWAETREEFEVRLAAMGLEVNWGTTSTNYSVYPVRRIQ